MYDLGGFGAMIADSVRMGAYEEALREVVTPDSVVLDIGAGPGIMSLLAARMGARQVIAVEPNPLVRIGARLAVENGLEDRICFVHGLSQEIEMKEKADVVVADLRGGLPNVHAHIDALEDARHRLMKPGGVLIPLRDTVFTAPVQVEEAYSKLVSPWQDNAFGLKMAGAAGAILNQGALKLKSIDRLLGGGKPIATLEYMSVESPSIDAVVELQIEEVGVANGLSLWFETELIPGIGFSTAPDKEKTVYGRLFLPLSQPVEVDVGDRIHASVKAVIKKDENLWIWRGRVEATDGSKKASFASSTAFFNPETPAVREVFHESCTPSLSDDGRMVRNVLNGVDGNRSVTEIAIAILAEHPDRFEYDEDAVSFVRDVVERHGDTKLCLDD